MKIKPKHIHTRGTVSNIIKKQISDCAYIIKNLFCFQFHENYLMFFQDIHDFFCRDDESVIYGHNYGKTEIFYQESTPACAGLPTPADVMGVIPLKARRRLERDHSIIIH